MNEFENKQYEGIYYSRFVASWLNESCGERPYRMKEWLKTLIINDKPIPNEIINEITDYGRNGKLELETSVRRFCSGNLFVPFGQKIET